MNAVASCRIAIFVSLLLIGASTGRAQDAAVANELTGKGAKLTTTHDAVTGLELPDLSKWTDADFTKVSQLTHLQKLSFGRGLTNHDLSLLTSLPDVTTFTTNGSELDDDGVRQFAHFPKLQVLTFFHPAKAFTGAGLADLAALPNLQGLTVAGSGTFGNAGMAAIARLSHLQSLRVWHINADSQGVALFTDLPKLRSVTLGQRLSNTPPTMVADDTIGILASFQSLESISLSEARLTLAALLQLKQIPSLTRLTLDSIEIPEADLEKLRAELPRVQIKFTPPTPEATKRIQALFGEK